MLDDPTGYGRIVRGADDRVLRIVEQRDASRDERAIREVCTSIYAFRRDLLGPALAPPVARQCAGRVLPHRRRRVARRNGPPGRLRHGAGRRDAGRQRSLAARPRRARAAGADEPPVVAQWRDDARPASDVHRRHRRPRPRRHAVSGHDAARLDRRRQRLRDRPEHPADRLQGRRSGHRRVLRGESATIGAGARVGPYAALPPGTIVASEEVTGPFYTAQQ